MVALERSCAVEVCGRGDGVIGLLPHRPPISRSHFSILMYSQVWQGLWRMNCCRWLRPRACHLWHISRHKVAASNLRTLAVDLCYAICPFFLLFRAKRQNCCRWLRLRLSPAVQHHASRTSRVGRRRSVQILLCSCTHALIHFFFGFALLASCLKFPRLFEIIAITSELC